MYGNTGAANGLTSSANSDRRVSLNAYVKVGEGRLGAGLIDRTTRAASGLVVARLTYNLSKRTAVYGGIAHMTNSGLSAVALDAGGTVGGGKSQSGAMGGVRHAF